MPALIRKQLSRQSNVAAVVMLSLLFAVDFTIGFDRVCWCLLDAPSMILSAPFCLRRRLRHGARHGACHGSITEEAGKGGGIVNCRMIFETSQPPWSREGKKIHVTVANRRLLRFLRRLAADSSRILSPLFPGVRGLLSPKKLVQTRQVPTGAASASRSRDLTTPSRKGSSRAFARALDNYSRQSLQINERRKHAIHCDSELMEISQRSRLETDFETDSEIHCSAFHMASTSGMNELVSRSRGEKRPREVARGARGWVSYATRWRRVRHCNSLQPLLLVTLRGLLLSTVSHCGDESDWPLEPSAAQVS